MQDGSNAGPLEAALAEALAERERLDVVIDYLSEKLGRPNHPAARAPQHPVGPVPRGPKVDIATGRVDPVSLVAEGEFFGQSMPSAAFAVLRKVGRPNALKTDQLVQAIRKGGVSVASGGTLYRSINRNSRFRRVGKGLWGLSEWYPTQHRTATPNGTADEVQESPETEERPDDDA